MAAARGLALAPESADPPERWPPGALTLARRRGLRIQALVSPADGAEAADLRRELGALWGLDAAGIPLLPEPPSPLTAASPPRVVPGTACRARLRAGDVALRDRLRSWCGDWPELTLLDPSAGQVTARALARCRGADPPDRSAAPRRRGGLDAGRRLCHGTRQRRCGHAGGHRAGGPRTTDRPHHRAARRGRRRGRPRGAAAAARHARDPDPRDTAGAPACADRDDALAHAPPGPVHPRRCRRSGPAWPGRHRARHPGRQHAGRAGPGSVPSGPHRPREGWCFPPAPGGPPHEGLPVSPAPRGWTRSPRARR